jgi:short-subunit dehydrogenase
MNRGVRKELALLTGLASAGCLLLRKKKWARALALGAAALHFFPSLSYSLRNRAVVITGSSRGLGLALAEEFLRHGARVALLARDADELDRAQELLQQRVPGQIFTLSCDVTKPEEVRRAFEQIEGFFGRIDVLVNNAGSILIGPLESMERADFDALLDLQVHAIFETTQAVLPGFRQAGGGRVVNICSIGGKIALPHMSTYCAAKFALAGLSSVMAAELARQNVVVTTVFPGMMRVGSQMQAVFKGDHEKEYAWFALGDMIPGASVSAEYAAGKIVAAVRAGDAQVIFPTTAKLAAISAAVFPELHALALRTAARFFPQGQSSQRRTGAESSQWLEDQPWYSLFRPAAEAAQEKSNQRARADAGFNLGL